MTTRAVVVGLGNIGSAMAERLISRGRDVVGVDISSERRNSWKATTGAVAVATLEEIDWSRVSHVLVVVRLTHQVEGVLQQLDALPVAEGTGVVVASTLDIDYARGLGRYVGRSWRLIEMPVSGGEYGARSGTLTVLPSGACDQRDFELLGDLSSNTVGFEKFGQPTLAKLLNNVSAAYTALSYAEVMLLAERSGMDSTSIAKILRTSSGGSWMGDHFMVLVDELLAKDVDLLRGQLGELPDITLNGAVDIVARLQAARALLSSSSNNPAPLSK